MNKEEDEDEEDEDSCRQFGFIFGAGLERPSDLQGRPTLSISAV